MRITLPYPPSVNHLFSTFRGRRIKSKEGRQYAKNVGVIALVKGLKPIDGPVSVRIDAYRKRKAGDLDNCLKSLFDSLKGIAWHDDAQIVHIEAQRFDDKYNPRVEVEIVASV